MCFALFIAVGSFIAVPERVAALLPDVFATPAVRGLAVALVFVSMFYWLWRVRRHDVAAWLNRQRHTPGASVARS
jgi:hypothetical protein